MVTQGAGTLLGADLPSGTLSRSSLQFLDCLVPRLRGWGLDMRAGSRLGAGVGAGWWGCSRRQECWAQIGEGKSLSGALVTEILKAREEELVPGAVGIGWSWNHPLYSFR